MVWSQYVYEATAGFDADPSDEEEFEDDIHLSVEDWQIKYSDELWDLWDIMQELIRDAFLEHNLMTECTFSDFAEFCYNEHNDDSHYIFIPYESTLSYIWGHIQDYIDALGLRGEFMVGATYDNWVRFAVEHTREKSITIY